ncbi:hypothetical protein M011DRAFT_472855 [Sporormia fimetaria CBS 119925]|uniref:Uncharacterized protein n=1 Tax=Sporormia fimetaria CBS 119925 TaxID=1340428 RepID=A0A6A6UWF5_9PLEO|nr:hypothetical protein M011DRAFT_472855 [Sporormia fimetaria CBS 119925]
MAQLLLLPQDKWHYPYCMLCGGGIDKESVKTYRALGTLPNQECLMHDDPVFEDGWIQVGSFRSSRFRCIGSLPRLYSIYPVQKEAFMIRLGLFHGKVQAVELGSKSGKRISHGENGNEDSGVRQ